MSFNAQGSSKIGLELFGGLVTEMDPIDLPTGVSPDCQDVGFTPGSVFSRPALERYANTLSPGNNFVYGKSFVTATGDVKNLFMDDAGNLFAQDLTTGSFSNIFVAAQNNPTGNFTFASYCRSITANGREYIAISDLLHGSDVPLQYDGTFLDRYTQEGPAAAPTITSLIIPASTLSTSGANLVLNVASVQTSGLSIGPGGIVQYLDIIVTLASPYTSAQVYPGLGFVIAGNSNSAFNTTWTVAGPLTSTTFSCFAVFYAAQTGTGGTATFAEATQSLQRSGNIVTATTTTAHRLQVGYQAQISGLGTTAVGGGITSIVLNNESLPGLATITTTTPHGLVPNTQVVIQGVGPTAVGGGIATVSRQGDVTTVVTNSAHNLQPGAQVTIAGVSASTFNGNWTVSSVINTTTFTFVDVDADATSTGGTVSLLWPIPDTATPTYFNVETCPTANSFTVQLTYTDGTWSSGTVAFPWDGTFYVTAVITATIFQYQQYGPPATINSAGTVTPFGQATPGVHSVAVCWLTRQGYVTRPGPAVQFIANGGQYLSISNIPIGASNVVARILIFTGSGGSKYFYIPVPGNVAGITVSTSTVVNDNATTSALLDFSDNTLFAAVGCSIPGNNLAAQYVMDGALGFASYKSRILTWGQRNNVQNLLNMGFDGGFNAGSPSQPLGWNTALNLGGALSPPLQPRGLYQNTGWLVSISGSLGSPTLYGLLSQSAYQDSYNNPILKDNTPYGFRAFVQTPVNPSTASITLQLVATLTSLSTGFSSTATIVLPLNYSGFVQGNFTSQLPVELVPPDLVLSVGFNVPASASSLPVQIFTDEWQMYYAQTPYTDQIGYGSYVNNPEAQDGLTSPFGSDSDERKMMCLAEIRTTMYELTQEPAGKLHELQETDAGEPVTWKVKEVASNCGVVGPNALTVSQADESSSSGGEEWFSWISNAGARIFGGGEPKKISQEIQSLFQAINYPTGGQYPAAQLTCWACNDPVNRIIYYGIPKGTAGAPNQVLALSYRELDTAEAIAASPPFHPSLSGRLIATDNTRKWSPWNMQMNGCALMYQPNPAIGGGFAQVLQPTFFGGNGLYPGAGPGFGNCYILNPAMYTDDDYGQIFPYYTTAFIPTDDQEDALQLGGDQKMLAYFTTFISGLGQLTIQPLCDSLTNPWPLPGIRTLVAVPKNPIPWPGASARGARMAIRFSVAPIQPVPAPETPVTDNWFSLSKATLWMKMNARLPVRGAL